METTEHIFEQRSGGWYYWAKQSPEHYCTVWAARVPYAEALANETSFLCIVPSVEDFERLIRHIEARSAA